MRGIGYGEVESLHSTPVRRSSTYRWEDIYRRLLTALPSVYSARVQVALDT